MRFINIIMLVSVIGITVGVAALVIVLSVFNGFNSRRDRGAGGIRPAHPDRTGHRASPCRSPTHSSALLAADPRIKAFAPFISSKALLMTPSVNKVVSVKGVDDSLIGSVSGVEGSTVLGAFEFNDSPSADRYCHWHDAGGQNGGDRGIGDRSCQSPVGVDAMMLQWGQPLIRKCTGRRDL